MTDSTQRTPGFPGIRLEVVESVPTDKPGFLALDRRRYRAHYPDESVSAPFVYDQVTREALDAAVIAAHYLEDGVRFVYLRSAVRPPVASRTPRAATEERARGGGLWELPAGLVEPTEVGAEGPRRTAQRELLEEVGFDVPVAQFRELGPSTFPAPAIIGERHYYFEVDVGERTRGEPELDGSALEHFGVVVALSVGHVLELCRSGGIEDAKTELAVRRLVERYA